MRSGIRIALCCALLLLSVALPARAETVWFVVGEIRPERNDSYLLPLSNPEDIAQARALLASGPGGAVGSIVIARIAAGADGLNRDWRASGQPLWSWHVVEFEGFADFAIELCDGWPRFVESDVAGWIANTDSRVCFWSYTIVEELTEPPPFAITGQLDGAWYDPAKPGQGLLLYVLDARREVFGGWFTFAPRGAGPSTQRWLTAQGPYAGGTATLTVTRTTGGAFNAVDPVQNVRAGTLELEFSDCNHATARYQLDGEPSGAMALQRVVPLEGCGGSAVPGG